MRHPVRFALRVVACGAVSIAVGFGLGYGIGRLVIYLVERAVAGGG